MECENLNGIEKDICEQEYCYIRGAIDKSDDSCICNDFCYGSNCDTVNSWKFTCENHSGTGVSTDDECNVCTDCVCSASENSYVEPTVTGSISSSNNPNNNNEAVNQTPTVLPSSNTNSVTPIPFESTVTPLPNNLPSISNNILEDNVVNSFENINNLKEYSKIFKFILRKLKPKRGSRESLNFLYQKYSEWLNVYYTNHQIESENEFNLIFFQLFENFEGTYLIDIEFDNYKIIDMNDNELISIINRIEKNPEFIRYLNDNLEFNQNSNTSLNNIYLDYSNWVIVNNINNRKNSFELEVFLNTFFEQSSNKNFNDLKLKNITDSELSKQNDILELFFNENFEESEGNNLTLEQIYNLYVIWYSENYPDKILIPQVNILSYLRINFNETSTNTFSNIKIKHRINETNIIKDNIIKNYINDNLKKYNNGNLRFNNIIKDFEKYVKKFYPNYNKPNNLDLKNKLNEKFEKNTKGNYKLKFKKPNPNEENDLYFGFIPKWVMIFIIIIIIIILLVVIYFIYSIVFNKPVDHFKGTFLYKQFLPYFTLKTK
jgi:hypothetical protein